MFYKKLMSKNKEKEICREFEKDTKNIFNEKIN